jgi:hypothetical protein
MSERWFAHLGGAMKVTTGSVGVIVASVLAVSGCTTAGVGSPNISPSTIGAIADPIGALTIPASSESALTYVSSDAFDRSLHASMKGRTRSITVTVPSSASLSVGEINTAVTGLTQGDERMVRWTRRVKESGGALIACENTRPESGIWAALALLLNWGSPILTEYLTYRPAGEYHAIVFHRRGGDQVEGVKFVRRDASGDPTTLTCQAAAAL